MTQYTFGFSKPPSGTTLRDAGVEKVTLNTSEGYRESFNRVLGEMADTGQPFSSEDVTAVVGQPSNPNTVGALFIGAAKRGVIRKCGYRQSTRPERHAAVIALWEGKLN